MLKERQKNLFKKVVDNYIKTAEPVGSNLLCDSFDLSSATIRNEMAELERLGLIYQPYTSSGRVPTELGYKLFVNDFLQPDKEIQKRHKKAIDETVATSDDNQNILIKNLSKKLAEVTENAILVGFDSNDVYYTGLSNLFAQPEFEEVDMVRNFSAVIDHLDEVMSQLFSEIEDMKILIGKDNPFGIECSSVITKFKMPEPVQEGIIGMLGPMRMDYQNNYSILAYSNQLISEDK